MITALSSSPSSQMAIPRERLYSPRVIAWMTFLFSPLAGALLIGINYRTLKDRRSMWIAIACGVALSILLTLIALSLSIRPMAPMTNIPLALAAGKLATNLQGDSVDIHENSGGRLGSGWIAACLSLPCSLAIWGLIFTLVYFGPPIFRHEVVAGHTHVFYDGEATPSEAQELVSWLKVEKLWEPDQEAYFEVARRKGIYTITMAVDPEALLEKDANTTYSDFATQISRGAFRSLPLKLKLEDPNGTLLAEYQAE